MDDLSLDYAALMPELHKWSAPDAGAALLDAVADWYISHCPRCVLAEFRQAGAVYLFDFAISAHLPQEDRTVAAWTLTPPSVGERDVDYHGGFPMSPRPGGGSIDWGHLIGHLSGGELGPNIFPQDRALNRGWSMQRRRYRTLEREAATHPGSFFFGHLIYADETADPRWLEIGLLRGTVLHVDRFDNRPQEPDR